MRDDYLWDGSGEPDPEIQRIESALGRFRHNWPARKFLEECSALEQLQKIPESENSGFALSQSTRTYMAIAAMALLALVGALLVRRSDPRLKTAHRAGPQVATTQNNLPAQPNPAWNLARIKGSVKVAANDLGETGRLALGEWLETAAGSRVRIDVDTIGEVDVEPNTRLRLINTSSSQHRLALARGTIRARIWAPPGDFVVDTPSAVAVDLGCAYTLQVDDQGRGLVRVTMGWVGFQFDGRESFIPAGALCATRPGVGPGTPHFEDASQRLRAALARLDFEKESPRARDADLDLVLGGARKRDAVTLWHLLSRVRDAERGRVYDRLAELIPPPQGVSRDGALRLEKSMLDLWWDQLGLGDTSWWRMWERPWR